MTTFQRLMALYWCLLPLELIFTWLDVSRQRVAPGTGRRAGAARRQLFVVPGVAAQYVVAFAVALTLVARLRRLDGAQQLLGIVCSVLLLASAWNDTRRIVDAWRESGLRRRARRPSEVEVGVDRGMVGGGMGGRGHGVVVREQGAVLAAPDPSAEDRPAHDLLEQRR